MFLPKFILGGSHEWPIRMSHFIVWIFGATFNLVGQVEYFKIQILIFEVQWARWAGCSSVSNYFFMQTTHQLLLVVHSFLYCHRITRNLVIAFFFFFLFDGFVC